MKLLLKPYDFQLEGVELAYKKRYSINAFTMGLGKTLVGIALAVKAQSKRVLVICPAFLKPNWEMEIEKFCSVPSRFEVTSYEKVKHIEDQFHLYDTILIDEAHYLKSLKAKRTQRIHKLVKGHRPKYLLLLTGTPVKNRVPEFYSLLLLCWYGGRYPEFSKFSDSSWDFQCRYTNKRTIYYGQRKVTSFEGLKNVAELKQLIKPIYLRRRAEDVLSLPEENHSDVVIADTSKNDLLIQEAWARYQGKKDASSFSSAKAVNALSKVSFTVEFVRNLLEEASGVVVFTDHIQAAVAIARDFPMDDVRYVTGRTKITDRAKYVEELNSGKVKILVSTIGSLSVGVNLTGVNYMVFNDFAWVEADMAQARKRIHRIGQKNRCFYYYIYSSKIDKHIHKTLKEKQKLIQGLET